MLYFSRHRKNPWRTWRVPFLRIKNSQSRTLLCNKYIFIQLGYIFHTYTHSPPPAPYKQWPTFYSFPDYSENSQFDNPPVLGLCLLHQLSQETTIFLPPAFSFVFSCVSQQGNWACSVFLWVSILNTPVNSIRGNTITIFFNRPLPLSPPSHTSPDPSRKTAFVSCSYTCSLFHCQKHLRKRH